MSGQPNGSKMKFGKRCYVGEFASPEVKWLEDAKCPICGGCNLMDAKGAALCVSCNKFVKPKRK